VNKWIRRIRHGTRLPAWAGVVQHLSWEAQACVAEPSTVELTWRVPEDVLPELLVLWPRRYSSPAAGQWLEPLRRGIAGQVPIRRADVPQQAGNIVLLIFHHADSAMRVGVDYDDRNDLHPVAKHLDLYFKMQYACGGYGFQHVVPGGYLTKKLALYRHAARWRTLRTQLGEPHDVFGRFGLRHGADIRLHMLRLMNEQRCFAFEGGAARTTWWEHMQDICRSKVCLDAPGRGEFSYRLVECLALGSCIVGPRLNNELHVPLQNGIHDVRVDRGLSDLVESCHRLLQEHEERRRVSAAAADYFDRYLRPEQLGSYYVDQCLRVTSGK
jgi:hypothetical protein